MADTTETTSLLTPDFVRRLYAAATEQSFKYAGAGHFGAFYQTVLSRIDRYGINHAPPNHELAGYTFITRPKLNLATPSLRMDRTLATLDTVDPVSLPFAIRCLLDTKFASDEQIVGAASKSPFFNDQLPFIVPLGNCLQAISGFPDFVVDTETTEGGFFGEDQTTARGSDMMNRSYDLTLTFRDIQGGILATLLYLWAYWIALVTRGYVTAYPEDIMANRLCYTCSIYRFVLDPSRRFITKWLKATGCFPKMFPIGAMFNIGEREQFLESARQFSVNFTVNKIETMDPIIFSDFNTVVKRFAGDVTAGGYVEALAVAEHNYAGIPWIDTVRGLNEIKFMCRQEELDDPMAPVLEEIKQAVAAALAARQQPAATLAPAINV